MIVHLTPIWAQKLIENTIWAQKLTENIFKEKKKVCSMKSLSLKISPLGLVHSHVHQMSGSSKNTSSPLLVILHGSCRFTVLVRWMKYLTTFKKVLALVDNQIDKKFKYLWYGNGGKYVLWLFGHLLSEKGWRGSSLPLIIYPKIELYSFKEAWDKQDTLRKMTLGTRWLLQMQTKVHFWMGGYQVCCIFDYRSRVCECHWGMKWAFMPCG